MPISQDTRDLARGCGCMAAAAVTIASGVFLGVLLLNAVFPDWAGFPTVVPTPDSPGATPTLASPTPPLVSVGPAPVTTPAMDAQSVVAAYYEAVNAGQLHHAWANLGGKNMVASWATFEAGYKNTDSVTCYVTAAAADSDQVQVWLVAVETGGVHSYTATYTVVDGEIMSGTFAPAAGDPPSSTPC